MKRVTHAKGFHTFHTFYHVHVINTHGGVLSGPRSVHARYMRHAIPHAKVPDAQACLTCEVCVRHMRSLCELKGVRSDLHKKRQDCALLPNVRVLSCPRFARSEHTKPVKSGGIEVFQRVWRAKRSHSTVGGSEAAASSSQPRKAVALPIRKASR